MRASHILLAISIVILAIGIILIVNHSVLDRTTEPPAITTLVDRTVVVPSFSEGQRFDFNVPRTGVLRVNVEVISGGIISFYLYKGSELWWNGEEGHNVIRSNFEVPIDAGRYYLIVQLVTYPWSGGTPGDRTVSVCLEFEG